MKLSPDTLTILKNFARINTNLFVEKDSDVLVTCSPTKTVLASATVPDTFPVEFGIYDMNAFLGALSIFDDPDIEFGEKHCVIADSADARKKLTYHYASKSTLMIPTVKEMPVKNEDVVCTFHLEEESLKSVTKAASLMQLDCIAIAVDKDKASVGAKNKETGSGDVSNSYAVDITEGVTRGDAFAESHVWYYDKGNVSPVSESYDVRVTKNFMEMTATRPNGSVIKYWFACMVNS